MEMGDDDKEQDRKENEAFLEQVKIMELEVIPPGEGSGRSRGVHELPHPHSSPQEAEGEGDTPGERKRARRQEEGVADNELSDGDDVFKVNPEAEDEIDKRSSGGGEPHPCLFLETVLDVVFKHIINQPGPPPNVSKDVQSIRQVCNAWSTSVTRLYRRTRPPTTFREYEQRHPHFRKRKSLTQFVTTMRSSGMIPVQNYSFWGSVFSSENLEMFRDFLVICLPGAVSICMSIQLGDAERIMGNLKDLPDLGETRLKTLNIRIGEGYQGQVGNEDREVPLGGIEKLLELLLNAGQTLHEVELSFPWPSSGPPNLAVETPVVEQLSEVLSKRMPGTVKQLKLQMEMNESCFNNLAGMQAKLETFNLGIESLLEGKVLHKFLLSQAATLQHLLIRKIRGTEGALVVEFPRLGELLQLELPEFPDVSIATPDFADTFPKLQSLNIWHISPLAHLALRDTTHTNALLALLSAREQRPSGSLKILDLPTFSVGPAFLMNISHSFPSITELHILLNNGTREALGEIFTYFGNLESLAIGFLEPMESVHWVDSMFSGVSESDCSRITCLQDFGNENLKELQCRPSLLNLTKLRKLVVWTYPGNRWVACTDFTAHFLFLEMENLREIRLAGAIMRFSQRYTERLRDKLVLRLYRDGRTN